MLPTTNLKNVKRANQRLTNYRKRFTLLKSNFPRLVIRFTNRQIIMQLVTYEPTGDRVLKTWLSAKLPNVKKYNTSIETLLALYKKVESAIREEYSTTYRFIIDSGLKNNSLKLTTLYDTFKN